MICGDPELFSLIIKMITNKSDLHWLKCWYKVRPLDQVMHAFAKMMGSCSCLLVKLRWEKLLLLVMVVNCATLHVEFLSTILCGSN